jgi:hypothetical protein
VTSFARARGYAGKVVEAMVEAGRKAEKVDLDAVREVLLDGD